MKTYNYIFCDLEDNSENEPGKQHNINVRINAKDDHHFLDMLQGILMAWSKSNHNKEGKQDEN